MALKTRNIQLLATLVDFNDQDISEYRFLVDNKHVKYVTVDPGVFPRNYRTVAPVVMPMFPPFPPGDWNEGHISEDPMTGQPIFCRTANSDLAGIKDIWHHTKIDHLELTKIDRIRQNIHLVTHPRFDRTVVVKFAGFPWQIPFFEAETTAYKWIETHGIGPKFLGHVTEEGRVIGFLMENIEGARSAEPGDLTLCQDILAKLHSLGIKHGDIDKHNFLVRDGKAVLIDLQMAERCNREELELEYQQLEQVLNDPSHGEDAETPTISE